MNDGIQWFFVFIWLSLALLTAAGCVNVMRDRMH
jgi:hypothetical protein